MAGIIFSEREYESIPKFIGKHFDRVHARLAEEIDESATLLLSEKYNYIFSLSKAQADSDVH